MKRDRSAGLGLPTSKSIAIWTFILLPICLGFLFCLFKLILLRMGIAAPPVVPGGVINQHPGLVFILHNWSFLQQALTDRTFLPSLIKVAWWELFVVGGFIGIEISPVVSIVLIFLIREVFPWPDGVILRPIPPALAYDPLWPTILSQVRDDRKKSPELAEPALPWVLAGPDSPCPAGSRRNAWNLLSAFVREGSSDGRQKLLGRGKHGWLHPVDPGFLAFQWALVTGQPGSGKSRIAVEFLRKLGRRDDLEKPIDDPHALAVPCPLSWWRRRRLLWGEFSRRHVPWLRWRASDLEQDLYGDPWDIGWLRQVPEGSGDPYKDRKADSGIAGKIGAWKPRRPTALLLDDPLDGEAEIVIQSFSTNKYRYRFPVRLLIVSQSIPSGLGVEARSLGKEVIWKTDREDFSGVVVTIAERARLNKDEILSIAKRMPPPLRNWCEGDERTSDHLKAIEEITRGNALLVELALRKMRFASSLNGVSAARLIEERADRIFKALKRGFQGVDEHLPLLASYTLAGPEFSGGARRTKAHGDLEAIKRRAGLRRCLNLAIGADIPAVRPETIGYAFVQLVLADPNLNANRHQLLADAWKLSPKGVQAAVERAGARIDELGSLLRKDLDELLHSSRPPSPKPNPADMASAYVTASVRFLLGQPRPTSFSRDALARGLKWIDRMSPKEA